MRLSPRFRNIKIVFAWTTLLIIASALAQAKTLYIQFAAVDARLATTELNNGANFHAQMGRSGSFASPTNPPVRRKAAAATSERIYLIHADNLWKEFFSDIPDAQRFSGHVHFRHNGMNLTCDSAVYFEASNSFEAFGNVHMTQGDTLSLRGRRLYYHGDEQMAEVRQDVVLKHRAQTLTTDSLNYDLLYKQAYFFDGGKLVENGNVLTADWGEYHTDTRQATFNYNVVLTSPKEDRIVTDTLHYDMPTHWASVVGPSNIFSKDSKIFTTDGAYNTDLERVRLFQRSQITNKGTTMTGDSIFYDEKSGEMQAFRNVVYDNRDNKNIMYGDFCQYNEQTGEALAYGRTLAKDYSNPADTLFVHADTIRMHSFFMNTDSVQRVMHGYYHVRAFRSDVQAVADSLVMDSRTRCLSLFRDPVVWSDNRQIVGERIDAYMNDSTIDSVYVREQAILIEQLDSIHFNQVAGQLMRSYFKDGEPQLNCVDGNVYVVNFPLEKDSLIIYQNYVETAKLRMYMKDRKLQRIWAPASTGGFYVAGLAPEEKTYLSNFAWFDYMRPVDKNDLFEWRPKKSGTELKASVRHEAPLPTLKKGKAKNADAAIEATPSNAESKAEAAPSEAETPQPDTSTTESEATTTEQEAATAQ